MTSKSRRQYLLKIKNRYLESDKLSKQLILDEFCEVCGYNRKHAIRLLNGRLTRVVKKRGRKSKYSSDEFKQALRRIWEDSGKPCSKTLKSMIPVWLPFYGVNYENLSKDTHDKLLEVSPSTMDRVLRGTRKKYGRGRGWTKPGSLMRADIPIRTHFFDETKPGFVEADTVAHCGGSMAGSFIWSLTVTDINTTWTEVRAVWNKGAEGVVGGIDDILRILPFKVEGFDCDNGSEFLNHHLVRYCKEKNIYLTRSRPYRKNDNAHVEQKNWTHVRRLLGVDRIDNPDILKDINELYANQWSLMQNFFKPSMKLKKKIRVNSRYVKIYHPPKTPYQRILESQCVSSQTKEKLNKIYNSLDPFKLKKQIDRMTRYVINNRTVASL